MHIRILAALALGVALMGCTMGLGEKLDPKLVQSFKLQQVSVAVPPETKFWWGDGERAYARSIGRSESESQTLGATPEARNFMRAQASERIKTAFDRELTGRLNGTRPVRVEVVMDGASFRMKGRARLVDARTGQEVAINPNLTVTAGGTGGIVGTMADRAIAGDPMDRLAANLAQSYRNWLLVN
jgi:hypothetical protein